MIRYFPPYATAGFANLLVSTPSLLPCPPAKIMATVSCFGNIFSFLLVQGSILFIYFVRILPLLFRVLGFLGAFAVFSSFSAVSGSSFGSRGFLTGFFRAHFKNSTDIGGSVSSIDCS